MKEATGSGPKTLVPTGVQPARCYGIYYIGTHPVSFKGQPSMDETTGKQKLSPEVVFEWEFTKYMKSWKEGEPPQPLHISQQYSVAAGKKAKLPSVLKSWAGDKMPKRPEKIGVDLLKKFLGQACMITVTHTDDKEWANVGDNGRSISPFMTGTLEPPKKHNTPVWFDVDEFTWDAFYKLPKFIQDRIRKSVEFPKIQEKNPETVSSNSASQETDGITVGEEGDEFKF